MIYGIDISHYQGIIDWPRLPNHIKFAFMKASEGDYFQDNLFERNWKNCTLLKAPYHFVIPNIDGDKQMDNLKHMMDGKRPDLPIALDVEALKPTGSNLPNATPQEVMDTVMWCINIAMSEWGVRPIIYTGAWFWNPNVPRSSHWKNYPLWVASYASKPYLPNDWDDYTIWQYSSKGRISGIAGNVDLNQAKELPLIRPTEPIYRSR